MPLDEAMGPQAMGAKRAQGPGELGTAEEERWSTCASAGSADDSATGHDAGRPDATTGHKKHKWHGKHWDCRGRSRGGDADQGRGGGSWQAGSSGAAATHDNPYARSPPVPRPPPDTRFAQPDKRQRFMKSVLGDFGRGPRGWRTVLVPARQPGADRSIFVLTVSGKRIQLFQQEEDMTVFFNPDPNGQNEWAIRGSFRTAILSPQGL